MKIKRSPLIISYIILFTIVLAVISSLISCKHKASNDYQLTGNAIVDGENLVQINCTKCHKLVPANALSKSVWLNHTLPTMAKYFKVSTYGTQYFKNNPLDTAGITLQNWAVIVAYYQKIAPDTLLPAKLPTPMVEDWAGFNLKKPESEPIPVFTTMVKYDGALNKLFTSDASTGRIYSWGKDLTPKPFGTNLPSPVVDALFFKDNKGINQALFSCIGELIPMDFPNGKVLGYDLDNLNTLTQPLLVASEVARPVQVLKDDFDKDGNADFVVLAQGYLKGGIYLYKQNKDKTFAQSTITEQPGAVQAVAGDFNSDGWPDLMVLFGSGDEGLWLFTNDKKGGFTSKNLLRFPPVYGSSSFQLADIDHDGKPDLIYTSGYNYHDSRIFKPYNGLYIFKNTGNWNFKQEWFYPINGCTKAVAADFDNDGDLDIATIAFFADLKNNPKESFIYFEQKSAFNFMPHAIPINKYGHWMTMDVADYNGDGKPDIILGNYSRGLLIQSGFTSTWDEKLPIIVLENNYKK
jgi:hypothetical protein